jgi:uncharacterized membrane protein
MKEREEFRKDFIKEMYGVYWENITRSMDGVWKVLTPLAVVGTIIGAIHQGYLPAMLGILLAFLVIFWALNIMIDLNDWHRRNLLFLTKAEHEFLNPEDYGKILPSKYRTPTKKWITFYTINSCVFLILSVLMLFYAWPKLSFGKFILLVILVAIGYVITYYNKSHQDKSAIEKHDELFGNKTNPR